MTASEARKPAMSEDFTAEDFRPAARVVADSLNTRGDRLTTVEVTFHRFVLAEFNTHRAFSRNSASSRAVPITRTLALLTGAPVYPLSWPQERKGMQGGPELAPGPARAARQIWAGARDAAVQAAEKLWALGVHKSVANRLLEPFLPHTVIVSSTDWDNFFAQRCSPLAQPEIRAAAQAMREAYQASQPLPTPVGRWHLPYVLPEEREEHPLPVLRKVSAARCARVSYRTHDGGHDLHADLGLYQRLVTADPPHVSPLEHVATPTLPHATGAPGNFRGWLQLRHIALDAR